MKNLLKSIKLVPAVLAAALFVCSCGQDARLSGVVGQAPSSSLIVKALDINKYETIDTVQTDAQGRFSCKIPLQKGQPEFIYLFHGQKKIASLLLSCGDKVSVEADTLGNYSVRGSEESVKLAEVEREFAAAQKTLMALSQSLEGLDPSSDKAADIRRKMGQEYVSYYRGRVRYIMENSHSLTVVPVLYQRFGDNLPVFGQSTDAIHFTNICDSLETVYPDSKYVKALKAEAASRNNYLDLEARLKNATEIGYPDITLPNINAEKIALSSLDSKVILVQFWSAAEASQKMFNLDVLKPVYDKFHSKGFEIYQVSLDTDKTLWARVVKDQKLPWISVCDSRGAASPYVTLYNIPSVPATFIISGGELVDGKVIDSKSLENLLAKLLK